LSKQKTEPPGGTGKKLVSDGILTYVTEMASALLNLGTSILIARILGPSGRGLYAIFILIPMTLQQFGIFGLPQGVVHYMHKDWEGRGRRAANLVLAALVVGVPYAFLARWFFASGALAELEQSTALITTLVVACVPAMLFNAFTQGFVLGLDDLVKRNLLRIVELGVYFVGVVLFVLVFRQGVEGAMKAWASGVLATTVVSVGFLWPHLKAGRMVPDLRRLGLDFSFGIRGFLANVAFFLLYRLNLYLVSHFLDTEAVGHYSVAAALLMMMAILPQAIDQAFLPKVTARYADADGREEMTPLVSRLSLIISGASALAMAIGAWPLVRLLYGPDYLPAVSALLVLLPAVTALCGMAVLSSALQARGLPQWNSVGAVAGFVTNGILGLILIPWLGIIGASLASSAGYTVFGLVLVWAFLRADRSVGWADLLVPRRDDLVLLWSGVRPLLTKIGI
jgi:O-antigen/teichoic acid export membrane protein